jgi:biopolymer transport protein ExbB/TolQ
VSRETPVPAPPTPSALPADSGGLRLALLDLEAADRRLWSAIYLLRAASQIDDAVAALQSNDIDEVDRILLNARRSFDRAYTFSAEQEKGPIDTFRLQLGQARDDLHIRPEGLDRRLRQIRQLVLSLVDESGV